jgi:sensor c-di-GMP phosphodiesterase-like protein
MADALGLAVVAEGIEDDQQAEVLRQAGCAAGQGWLYSRAVPACALPQAVAALGAGTSRVPAPRAASDAAVGLGS